MSIGIRIKEARIKAGISQEALAKAIGSTKQAVYKYEAGIVTNIPMDKIEIMATVLSVTPAYLMGWNETDKKPADEGELSEEVVIYHRDGKTVRRKFSKEQLKMISAMLDAIPDDPDDNAGL